MFERFDVPYQPAMVFVAPDGTVEQVLGSVDEAEIAAGVAGITG